MPITITITGDTVQEVRGDFARLLGADLSTEQVGVDKPAKAPPKKAEPKAEAPATEEQTPPAGGEDKIALLKSLAMKYAQKNTREALVGLFAEYGATNPSTVPADQLDAVIARLQE